MSCARDVKHAALVCTACVLVCFCRNIFICGISFSDLRNFSGTRPCEHGSRECPMEFISGLSKAIFSFHIYICHFLLLLSLLITPKNENIIYVLIAIPWLRELVAAFSPRRHGLCPGSAHVSFVLNKMALGQLFLQIIWFSMEFPSDRCSILSLVSMLLVSKG